MTVAAKALAFDVFGTVVDWRGSIIKMGPVFDVPMIDQWATHVAAMWADGLARRIQAGELQPDHANIDLDRQQLSPEMANAKRGGRNRNSQLSFTIGPILSNTARYPWQI